MRTLITDGLIARSDGVYKADLLMDYGKILALGENLASHMAEGTVCISGKGCIVMPGGVDVHTHMELESRGCHVTDGFAGGSRAAACGGTTSIIEHPGFGPTGCAPDVQIQSYLEKAAACAIDYGLHGVLQQFDEEKEKQVSALIEQGIASFKAYTTYAGKLEDPALLRALACVQASGGLLTVHAENDSIPAWLAAKLNAGDVLAYPKSRPPVCEIEAVTRVLALAEAIKAAVYIVHLSTQGGLTVIREARSRGCTVFVETCPHYLVLTEDRYATPEGLGFIMAPPLRTEQDCQALWTGLADGTIDCIATDHCAFSLSDKEKKFETSLFDVPGGVAGVETRIPLLFSEGVLKARISLSRFVDLVSTAPARIMGLSGKGQLAVGMDADITLLDPQEERILSVNTLHQSGGFTPFAGMRVRGWPRHVWLRGEPLLQDGIYVGTPGQGQFLHRRLQRHEN